MFDDLRKDSDSSQLFQQEDEFDPLLDAPPKKRGMGLNFKDGKFLGMTAFQRFVISVMLLLLVSVIGAMFLIVTEKLLLPF